MAIYGTLTVECNTPTCYATVSIDGPEFYINNDVLLSSRHLSGWVVDANGVTCPQCIAERDPDTAFESRRLTIQGGR